MINNNPLDKSLELAGEALNVVTKTSEFLISNGRPILAIDTKFQADFNLTKEVKASRGPILEVGGPTDLSPNFDGFLTSIFKSGKNMLVSNITPGNPNYDLQSGDFLGYSGKIDLQADATNLGIRSESVGVLFASCLPVPTREQMTMEAKRTLVANGLFVVSAFSAKDINFAKSLGLELIEVVKFIPKDNLLSTDPSEMQYDAIFRKSTNIPIDSK